MTAAHNFQDDNEKKKNKTTHSILSGARCEVEFEIDGQTYLFGKQKRMAFVHHLQPGSRPDFKNKDIAMVKLGVQWEYGRKSEDYSDWEKNEQGHLANINKYAVAEIEPPQPVKGETVYAAHYGGDSHEKKYEKGIKILHITSPTRSQVPMLHLEKKRGVLPEGASGCPIMVEREDNYRLVGLHFSGDDDEEDGEAEALPWNQGIREYIQTGVSIIAGIGSYMAYTQTASMETAQGQMRALEDEAKGAKLTIYLSNGEVINHSNNQQGSSCMYWMQMIVFAVFIIFCVFGQYYFFHFFVLISLFYIICDWYITR